MDSISLQDAARYTGLSPQTLKIQAERGRLEARKVGGVWVTTVDEVLRYVATRRRNASDVVVICQECGRTFTTPSDAVPVSMGVGFPDVLGCPGCGSPSWGVAAVPDAGGQYGHRLEAALRGAIETARETGVGEAAVNDATNAFVRVRVLSGEQWWVEFDVDRDGAFDARDAERLKDHLGTFLGKPTSSSSHPVWRYEFTIGQPAPDRDPVRSGSS